MAVSAVPESQFGANEKAAQRRPWYTILLVFAGPGEF